MVYSYNIYTDMYPLNIPKLYQHLGKKTSPIKCARKEQKAPVAHGMCFHCWDDSDYGFDLPSLKLT